MEITPQKESIASTRTSVLSKTDFRLLPSRPPGRIRVTAGSSREALTTGGAIPTGDAPAQEEPPQLPVRPSNDSGASCAPACSQVFENAILVQSLPFLTDSVLLFVQA